MSPVCDVIIPVKDAVWWVAWCIEELLQSSGAELGEVVVVDDSSTPDSLATLSRLCSRFPRVRLVSNQGRPGFGGACNFGAALTHGSHVLFLNTDCFVTEGTVRKLMDACLSDPSIGIACPLSNNSPVLTLPMFPGRSYVQMNRLLEQACEGRPPAEISLEACTVVGNCLLVTRACWNLLGGFDKIWGVGYGEETDLQFRAMAKGLRGVVCLNTYVFHFGSATFRYRPDMSAVQQSNHRLFMERWGDDYRALAAKCAERDPLVKVTEYLHNADPRQKIDVLFLLPGISQSVGGIHVVGAVVVVPPGINCLVSTA